MYVIQECIHVVNQGTVVRYFFVAGLRSSAKVIIVIEKDATFQRLLDGGALQRLQRFIFVTVSAHSNIQTHVRATQVTKSNQPAAGQGRA